MNGIKINLLHDESQMGYGREDYEQALKSQKVWNNLTHVGGPRWVGKTKDMRVGQKDNKKSKLSS